MTVIFPIDNSTLMGGAQHSTLAIISAMERAGDDVTAVLPGAGAMHALLACRKITVTDRVHWRFSMRDWWGSGCDGLRVTIALWKLALRKRKAVFYANGIACYIYSYAASVCALTPPTVIFHERGFGVYPMPLKHLVKIMINSGRGRLIATSFGARNVWTAVGVNPSKIEVIYNGIDGTQFKAKCSPGKSGTERRPLVVGMVARFSRNKGHLAFVRAARKVVDLVGYVEFVIIGDVGAEGDDVAYRADVQREIQLLGLTGVVRLAGPVDYNEMAAAYEALDVFVNPCPREPFGRAIVEAMMTALPVVAINAAGPLEIIEEGQTGYLVPADNAQEMSLRIVQLLQDEALRNEMGAKARMRALKMFEQCGVMQQVVHLCHSFFPLVTRP